MQISVAELSGTTLAYTKYIHKSLLRKPDRNWWQSTIIMDNIQKGGISCWVFRLLFFDEAGVSLDACYWNSSATSSLLLHHLSYISQDLEKAPSLVSLGERDLTAWQDGLERCIIDVYVCVDSQLSSS